MSPLQAASLEERVAELESDLADLAAAAQAAEDQAVDLMQQVQTARAGESARESAALAEQARRTTTHINLVRAFMRACLPLHCDLLHAAHLTRAAQHVVGWSRDGTKHVRWDWALQWSK